MFVCFFQTQKVSSFLSYNIHYWIGSGSTQDEQGAAAVYTIHLDEFLGCAPVQHREVQNHESDTFRGYFKQGIIYKKGGVASGMRHTETNAYDVRRLLHVKGKKRVVAAEVQRRVQRSRGMSGQTESFVFWCASGGDELDELQPGRRVLDGHRQNHHPVERPEEQQTGKAQSKTMENRQRSKSSHTFKTRE